MKHLFPLNTFPYQSTRCVDRIWQLRNILLLKPQTLLLVSARLATHDLNLIMQNISRSGWGGWDRLQDSTAAPRDLANWPWSQVHIHIAGVERIRGPPVEEHLIRALKLYIYYWRGRTLANKFQDKLQMMIVLEIPGLEHECIHRDLFRRCGISKSFSGNNL